MARLPAEAPEHIPSGDRRKPAVVQRAEPGRSCHGERQEFSFGRSISKQRPLRRAERLEWPCRLSNITHCDEAPPKAKEAKCTPLEKANSISENRPARETDMTHWPARKRQPLFHKFPSLELLHSIDLRPSTRHADSIIRPISPRGCPGDPSLRVWGVSAPNSRKIVVP